MTIDFWGLGLQAVNVLILIWLLSRVFWRPMADAIARRQQASQATMDDAESAQTKADAALADVTQARAGIAAERQSVLDAARIEAEAATKVAQAAAQTKAEDVLAVANSAIAQDAETARKANAAQASELSLDIATRLLARLNGPVAQTAFLAELVSAIAKMPATDRATLAASPDPIDIVSATNPGKQRAAIQTAVCDALGGTPPLRFVTDPELIGGLELHGAHFVLRNSWQADLAQIRAAVKNAA